MLKKNSIYFKILIPIILITLVQSLLIGVVLHVNGTIKSLDEGAVATLVKDAENRSISLEIMMNNSWSNIDKLEIDLKEVINEYLTVNDITINNVLGDYNHENNILYNSSDYILNTLRNCSTNGIFFYFTGNEYSEEEKQFNGVYYRDFDVIATPADYSDILFLRGHIDISRKDKIQLDSSWSQMIMLSPKEEQKWKSYANPLTAANNYPELSSKNLSYWSPPYIVNGFESITYTRPLLHDGKVIGIIGTEMQSNTLRDYYPSSDFESFGKGSYMLIKYEAQDEGNEHIECNAYTITGTYVKNLMKDNYNLRLTKSDMANIYNLNLSAYKATAALDYLNLYDANAPFSDDGWALAAVTTDSMLYGSSIKLKSGILYSTIILLATLIVFIVLVIRLTTKPLMYIVNQIQQSDPDDLVVINGSNSYEFDLLCSTINDMKQKRLNIETELREERERYMIALENATDTFVEYDTRTDCFKIYYFTGDSNKNATDSKIISSFMPLAVKGKVCHKNDIKKLLRLITGEYTKPIELRMGVDLFSHINGETDRGYYWFLFKGSYIYDENNKLSKMIGIAKEITAEKQKELNILEASRRDITTGLYNSKYGEKLMYRLIREHKFRKFAVCFIRVKGFNSLEKYYGRVFGGAVMMMICREIKSELNSEDIAVRLNNSDIVLLITQREKPDVLQLMEKIFDKVNGVYTGENSDIKLSLSAGISLSTDDCECEEFLQKAYTAQAYGENNRDNIQLYENIPENFRSKIVDYRDRYISVFLDISKTGMIGFAFDLFERTSDTMSAINLLSSILGIEFGLNQIVICEYDEDFHASHIFNQWNDEHIEPLPVKMQKIYKSNFIDFEKYFDENGAMTFTTNDIGSYSTEFKKLMRIYDNETVSAYMCLMFENNVHNGKIIYKSCDITRVFTDDEKNSMREITKIISAHLSKYKSSSANKAKSEFLSRMSHEIRTPMNAIIGMTNMAKSSDDSAKINDCLEKIDFSAKHLLALINDILDISRIESGKMKLNNEQFSMLEFVKNIDTLMRPSIESRKIKFEVDYNIETDSVIGDEYKLRRVLVNFLGNSEKFTDQGGNITFSVRETAKKGGYAEFRISVKDDGIGIAKEDHRGIFHAFEQAVSEKSEKLYTGTGLGLAICANIVSAMGSEIELISEKGKGSEFYFNLRLEYTDEVKKAVNNEPVSGITNDYFNGKKVMLVEDNEINMEIASYILSEMGLFVDIAENGQECVDMFFSKEPFYYDAILMDIQMPVMDGLTATRMIRKSNDRTDAKAIPIIAMTANAFDEDMKKSIESGMNGHIAKPIDNEKLFKTLSELIVGER